MNVIAYISLRIIWQNKNGLKPWPVKHEQYDKEKKSHISLVSLNWFLLNFKETVDWFWKEFLANIDIIQTDLS